MVRLMKHYDIEKLNAIGISEVANMLGITLPAKKGITCFKGHDSKSPSLHFYLNTNSFYCFGCGIGSKNINLVKEYYDVSFVEACKILEDHFYGNYTHKIPKKKIIYKNTLEIFSYDSEVYQWILDNLTLSKRGLDYLKLRGFSEETIKNQKIFDIENPNTFFNSLREKWDEDRLYKCGLLKMYQDELTKCWWRHTIVFPYFNLDNQVIYLQGRFLDDNIDLRWVNLPNVKSSIYNLQILNECIHGEKIYICEGITDTITMLENGYKAVGIMGSNNFKKEYIYHFMNFDIYVVPDNDNGGDKFYKNIVDAFSLYKSIKRVTFDKKFNDISDYIKGLRNAQ